MNRSTRIKACVLSVVFTAVLLLAPFSPVLADSFPTYFNVNENNFYSAANIYVAYMELNQDQQDIANYLLGMYNLMYMGSRGFAFKSGTYSSQSAFIAKIKSFGYRLFYNASGVALQSRMNEDFCKYASAVLLYASQCNGVDFDDWFSNLDDDFIIPVDQGILNSFTLLYNDNSDEGIAVSGDIVTPWESGLVYEFGLSGISWYNSNHQTNYNNFIHRYDYILYSAVNSQTQVVCGLNKLPDTLFVLRSGNNNYTSFRYGYDDNWNLSIIPTSDIYNWAYITVYNNKLEFNDSGTTRFRDGIINSGYSTSDLSEFIQYVFYNYPVVSAGIRTGYPTVTVDMTGAYPYIGHVVLVDNLTTLSNPEEVFNVDSLDVVGLSGDMIVPIDSVNLKPKVLTTINLPDNSHSSVSIRDIINDDNVVDDQDQPTDPWEVNVIVQPNDTNPISIDVNMFSGGSVYLDYLWEHTRKVVVFAKDVLDCFEFEDSGGDSYGPKFAIYGVLVLGVAGGMIAKFLL